MFTIRGRHGYDQGKVLSPGKGTALAENRNFRNGGKGKGRRKIGLGRTCSETVNKIETQGPASRRKTSFRPSAEL